jgi:predicted nucleotidyltransferase component of viral defense system
MKSVRPMESNYAKPYWDQVDLLLQILPIVAQESCFALKGGTAINLFIRDMPRLSVDIDLTYLPLEPRTESLQGIERGLNNIRTKILQKYPSFNVENMVTKQEKRLNKLVIDRRSARIKIEPNTVLRGALLPIIRLDLTQRAENLFSRAILDIPNLSIEEIYAGKICAALDRQHPRDLFDIKILYENGGITKKMQEMFVAYLASSSRPMSEILNPNLLDQHSIFETDFSGMANDSVGYEELEMVRKQLIHDIHNQMTDAQRRFLLSVKMGEPNWSVFPLENLDKFPALQWKLMNIQKMDRNKHTIMVDQLKRILKL